VPFAEGSVCSLLKQGFIHSLVFRSKGLLGKGFTVRGFGLLIYLCWDLCFLPVALLLGGKKALSFFGIEIHYRSIELNLCLSILNGSKPLVVTVLSSEVRLLYQVCILL
jgi:hypothetical protein